MQSESNSRFNQSYYQPPPYESRIPQESQTRFSPYTPTQPTNYGIPSPLTPTPNQPNIPPTTKNVYIVPATAPQATSNEKNNWFFLDIQIEQNQRKYHIRRDSIIYQFTPQMLRIMSKRFQKEFPTKTVQQIKRNDKQFDNGPHSFYKKMFFGTIIYWVTMRRSNWFRLTHNVALKLTALLFCENKMWSLQAQHRDFFIKQMYENHKCWEDVIVKYGIKKENVYRLQQIS